MTSDISPLGPRTRFQLHPATWICLAAFIIAPLIASSQKINTKTVLSQDYSTQPTGNGIVVGNPKAFDQRALTLMLENLHNALRTLNTIDNSKITNNLGKIQGGTNTRVANSFSLSTLPTPALETALTNTSGTDAVITTEEKITENSFTPTAPVITNANPQQLSPSDFALAAQDILSEQVNLSYQILNLRMLLEQSVSDRVYFPPLNRNQPNQNSSPEPRAQAVLGFEVSLNPASQNENMAAIVEIELCHHTPGTCPDKSKIPQHSPSYGHPGQTQSDQISIVSMMPKEKTYNVATLTDKATSFAASAVVKVVTVGYSHDSSRQTYFLHRDSDTIAFRRESENCGHPIIGWQFRPVLGRKSVEPGPRQLFAVVALPKSADFEENIKVLPRVRTYWAKYNQRKGVIASRSRFPSSPTFKSLQHINILHPSVVEQTLSPKIKDVKLESAGGGKAIVSITGANMYTGTKAIINGKVLEASSDSLEILSENFLELLVDAKDLTEGSVHLRGRYGPAEGLFTVERLPKALKLTTNYHPHTGALRLTLDLDLDQVDLIKTNTVGAVQATAPPKDRSEFIEIVINSLLSEIKGPTNKNQSSNSNQRQSQALILDRIKSCEDDKTRAIENQVTTRQILVAVGDQAYLTDEWRVTFGSSSDRKIRMEHYVFLKKQPLGDHTPITVLMQLGGGILLRKSFTYYTPSVAEKIVIIEQDGGYHHWAIQGRGFESKPDAPYQVFADKDYMFRGDDYDLSLLHEQDPPKKGRSLVVVSFKGGNLNIRIFNDEEKEIIDKDQSTLGTSSDLAILQKLFQSGQAPDTSTWSRTEKMGIIKIAKSLVGLADATKPSSLDQLHYVDPSMLRFAIPSSEVSNVKNVAVKLGHAYTTVLPAPPFEAKTPTPKVTNSSDPTKTPPPSAAVNSASTATYKGSDLGEIAKVRFGTDTLEFFANSDGQELTVFLTRKVTEKAGSVSLVFESKAGKLIPAPLIVK